VKVRKSVLIGVFAVLALFTSLGPSAYAHGKHGSNSPHFKMKKNMGPFGGKYMAPKKQRGPSGYYRSTLTGKTVYGKPKP
jgi:hypothetical protein